MRYIIINDLYTDFLEHRRNQPNLTIMDSSIGIFVGGSSLKEEENEEAKENKTTTTTSNLDESFELNLGSPSTHSFNSSLSSSVYQARVGVGGGSTGFDSNYHSFLSADVDLKNNSLSPMSHSLTSLSADEQHDPWKASAIGIKCISYQPIGYVFLTRKILDMYSTDGKRKLEILYSFSKRYRNRIKVPAIGAKLNNCSFCDTITMDFDPDSSLFDLIMEVQIITQRPNSDLARRKSKLTTKTVKKATTNEISEIISSSSSGSDSENSDNEITYVTSTYDIKYHKDEHRPNLYEVLKSVNSSPLKDSIEDNKGNFNLLII